MTSPYIADLDRFTRTAANPLTLVLHMPKTAGKTLEATLRNNFQPRQWIELNPAPLGIDKNLGSSTPGWDLPFVQRYFTKHLSSDTRCVMGHLVYIGIHELAPAAREPRYITFLRDPVDRCISLYSMYVSPGAIANHKWYREIHENRWTLEEWFRNSQWLWRRDGQVRMLLQGSHPEVMTDPDLTEAHLEAAKQRLEEFWFFGLTERFREDALFLYASMGLSRYTTAARLNASVRTATPNDTWRLIASGNELDIELYSFAQSLRSEFITRHSDFFNRQVEQATRRARVRRAMVEVPSAPVHQLARVARFSARRWRARRGQ